MGFDRRRTFFAFSSSSLDSDVQERSIYIVLAMLHSFNFLPRAQKGSPCFKMQSDLWMLRTSKLVEAAHRNKIVSFREVKQVFHKGARRVAGNVKDVPVLGHGQTSRVL